MFWEVHQDIYDNDGARDAVRLRLRRACRGRPRAARRQGHRPRRDDAARRARPRAASPSRPTPAARTCARAARRPGSRSEVGEHIARLEEKTGKRFGDTDDPLLVSVRSGAAVSMPGMMDTILNLGLNDDAVEGLARNDGQPALRPRLVPAPDPDVRRGRRQHRRAPLRAGARRSEARARRAAGRRSLAGRSRRARRDVQGHLWPGDRSAISRRTRASSCAAPCWPCSSRGRTRVPRCTGARTASRTTSGRR